MAATKTATKTRKLRPQTEVNGKPKTVTFQGTKLSVPSKLPFRVLKYITAASEGSGQDYIAALELILGAEQMEKIWDLDVDMTKGGPSALADLLVELTDQVFAVYDSTPGE